MHNSKGNKQEKYKDVNLDSNLLLKTNGIYIASSDEYFKYEAANYSKIYSSRGHPALKGLIPAKDTIVYFTRYFYYHFFKNGTWSNSGGFYSKEEMINFYKGKISESSPNIYKICEDTLKLKSYNSYRRKKEFFKVIVRKDTILVSGFKNRHSFTTYTFLEL
ncbi:hypothetical protein FFWV33_17415 [Flavobacterium faecale]|uniref:Uncharacterized protein n=1 Tax=Flavobacterium faecale TaxID=1355330 RepID=A0A2S1LHB7_9FLAO|nr:hypothetical protein [Flavobacterium faecale]AWG23180.1 hypothetical protein FFWV33_17415 [Flavobacterium faecale]